MKPQRISENGASLAEDAAENWLLAIGQKQDRNAFIALFNHYAPRVKAYLRRQGLDGASAEDITQDIMLTIWKRAGSYDPQKARAGTWIFTIARNRMIDAWRSTKGIETVSTDDAVLPDEGYIPTDTIENAQENTMLRKAIATLPEAQRTMIEESYFAENTHRMIAKARKIPLGTVKSRLRLALDHLRAQLSPPGREER